MIGSCPRILFYCGWLQILRAALAKQKPPHHRHNCTSGAFGLAVLPEKVSLALVTKLFSDSLLFPYFCVIKLLEIICS